MFEMQKEFLLTFKSNIEYLFNENFKDECFDLESKILNKIENPKSQSLI
jgi:hypothetical protein